jgi:hypothetical protein
MSVFNSKCPNSDSQGPRSFPPRLLSNDSRLEIFRRMLCPITARPVASIGDENAGCAPRFLLEEWSKPC